MHLVMLQAGCALQHSGLPRRLEPPASTLQPTASSSPKASQDLHMMPRSLTGKCLQGTDPMLRGSMPLKMAGATASGFCRV